MLASGDWAELFDLLFRSSELPYGLFGILILLFVGYYISIERKQDGFGLLYFILLLVMSQYYLENIVTYSVHAIALIFGGFIVCLLPIIARRY